MKKRLRKIMTMVLSFVMVLTAVGTFAPMATMEAEAADLSGVTVTVKELWIQETGEGTENAKTEARYLYTFEGLAPNTNYELGTYFSSAFTTVSTKSTDENGVVSYDLGYEEMENNGMRVALRKVGEEELLCSLIDFYYDVMSMVIVSTLDADQVSAFNSEYGTDLPTEFHGVTYGKGFRQEMWGDGKTFVDGDGNTFLISNQAATMFDESLVDDSNIEEGYYVDGWLVAAVESQLINKRVVGFNKTVDLSEYLAKLTPYNENKYDISLYLVPNVVAQVDINDAALSSAIAAQAGNTPTISLTYDGETLAEDTDFVVAYYSDEACTVAVDDITKVGAGTYYAKITGEGKYMNDRVEKVVITAASNNTVENDGTDDDSDDDADTGTVANNDGDVSSSPESGSTTTATTTSPKTGETNMEWLVCMLMLAAACGGLYGIYRRRLA